MVITINKSLMGLKELDLGNAEMDGILGVLEKGEHIASSSKLFGWLAIGLGSADAGLKVYRACQTDPDSSLCHKSEVGNSGELAGNIGGSLVSGLLIKGALKKTRMSIGNSEPHYANEDMLNAEDDDFATHFKNDTNLPYNRNVLGLSVKSLSDEDMSNLNVLKLNGIKFGQPG